MDQDTPTIAQSNQNHQSGSRIQKGFDFLGYHFNGVILRPAIATIQRSLQKISQLYEEKPFTGHRKRLTDYVRQWRRWITAGVTLTAGVMSSVDAWMLDPSIRGDLHLRELFPSGMGVTV
jgi:hypothetical protein